MDEQVLLIIGSSNKFVMDLKTALEISSLINGSSKITTKWNSGNQASVEVIDKPDYTSAVIVPMTGHMQLTFDSNAKDVEKAK
jgi:hypothetical protein